VIVENIGLECRPCTDHGRRKCPLKHFKCMREIAAGEVVKAVRELTVDN
jgi:hypothetical protein